MATNYQNSYVIGVDVGGTKVAAGFVNNAGEISEVVRVKMVSDADAAAGLNSVTEAIDQLLKMGQERGWAVGAIMRTHGHAIVGRSRVSGGLFTVGAIWSGEPTVKPEMSQAA